MGMGSAQAVFSDNKVYFGGGLTDYGEAPAVLYLYSIATDEWDEINTPVARFAIAVYDKQLVLVGGSLGNDQMTNRLWTLFEFERDYEWLETLPPMKVKRCAASSVGHKNYLLVVGGDSASQDTSVTEVYNGANGWMLAGSLPSRTYGINYFGMKSVKIDGTWYLMGGEEQGESVFSASIDSLISSQDRSKSTWTYISDVPYSNSSPAVHRNTLIAIGGASRDSLPSSGIYYHSQDTKSWEVAGELPEGVSDTCTIVLPTKELMAIGGSDFQYNYSARKKVFISNLKDNTGKYWLMPILEIFL